MYIYIENRAGNLQQFIRIRQIHQRSSSVHVDPSNQSDTIAVVLKAVGLRESTKRDVPATLRMVQEGERRMKTAVETLPKSNDRKELHAYSWIGWIGYESQSNPSDGVESVHPKDPMDIQYQK